MLRKLTRLIVVGLVVALATGTSLAAPRDKAALKKIEEAIFTHFLNTDFDTAEGLLLGTIRACGDKCSAAVKAKAHMYVGIVRGSGRNDLAGAEESFTKALSLDPGVKLDEEMTSAQVKEVFEKAGGAAGGGAGEAPGPEGDGSIGCSPMVAEIQVLRPIPFACGSDLDLAAAKLHYKGVGQDWKAVNLQQKEEEWQGRIPCPAVQSTGKLQWYVEGLDDEGEVVDFYGSLDEPNVFVIVSETDEQAPSFPGEAPPAKCGVGEGGGGGGGECGGWGEPCGAGNCCDAGLACIDGAGEAKQCERHSQCGDGECIDGRCVMAGDDSGKPYAKNYVGAHFGVDFTSLTAENACAPDARTNDNFSCFLADGSTYNGLPNENAGGNIAGGFVPSTMRAMASYERLFGAFGLGARVGFAFNGGQTPEDGSAFFPVHVEGRAKYWVTGKSSLQNKGFRAYVHLGGGMAQVDAKVDVDIIDCPDLNASCVENPQPVNQPVAGQERVTVEAKKALGTTFVGLGGGVMYAIGPQHGPILNIQGMFMLPASGLVFQPSLGYAYGF